MDGVLGTGWLHTDVRCVILPCSHSLMPPEVVNYYSCFICPSVCKHWMCSRVEPDQGADLLTWSRNEKFFWPHCNAGGSHQLSAIHLLTSGAARTTKSTLVDLPFWVTDTTPIQSGLRKWVLSCVTPDWPTTVALSYKGSCRVVDAKEGSLFSLNSCTGWLTGQELAANSPHCFYIVILFTRCQIHLNFYSSLVCEEMLLQMETKCLLK